MKATFAEFTKWAKDLFLYLVGTLLEGSKEIGWKRALFVWPFVIIIFIILYLLYRILLGGWVK